MTLVIILLILLYLFLIAPSFEKPDDSHLRGRHCHTHGR